MRRGRDPQTAVWDPATRPAFAPRRRLAVPNHRVGEPPEGLRLDAHLVPDHLLRVLGNHKVYVVLEVLGEPVGVLNSGRTGYADDDLTAVATVASPVL